MQRPRHFRSEPTRKMTVMRTERPEVQDPEVSMLSDSKGLYDALNNELPQDDKKSAVETPIIEQMLLKMKGRARWIPHNFNPSDGLTKIKGAHLAPLFELLKTGFYHLKMEETQLADRAKEKESTGRKARHKVTGNTKSKKPLSSSTRVPTLSACMFFTRVVCTSTSHHTYMPMCSYPVRQRDCIALCNSITALIISIKLIMEFINTQPLPA